VAARITRSSFGELPDGITVEQYTLDQRLAELAASPLPRLAAPHPARRVN